jgi:catechol 2,3-dioxygenase-like lactoylglutathione lyase family enzyme
MADRVALDHVVLEVRDPEASVSFYRTVLGLRPVRLEEYRAGKAPFPSSRVSGGTLIDLFPQALWERRGRPRNPNHICLAVSPVEMRTIRRKLKRAHIAIERQSSRSYGARGWGENCYFRDPDGVLIEVRCYDGKTARAREGRS